MGEIALALALASVVTASLFLGLRASRHDSRDPSLDQAWTSYTEATRRAHGVIDETDGQPVHPTAALADYLQKRQDASDR